jgi:hypothetical protein
MLIASVMFPSVAPAQPALTAAQSTFIDPSITASGMGKTAVAVFWSEEPNDWSNPSLLGYQRGIRYSYGRTQLVPDLADGVFFTSHRIFVGFDGVGFSIAGKPVKGLGHMHLDYGVSEATDENGNVIGEFSVFEDIRQFGVGVSVFRALESLIAVGGGHAPDISRHVDISIGHAWKDVVVDVAPASINLGGLLATGEATEKDRGALLRVTPFGSVSRDATAGVSRARLDVAAGFSQRNYDDSQASHFESDPVLEERLVGGSARLTIPLPGGSSPIWSFLTPEINLAGTWEDARYYEGDVRIGTNEIIRTGQEVTLLGVVSLRHGFIDAESNTIQDDTWGIGVSLQYQGMFGARYDWAQIPQSEFLDNVTRNGFSVFIDPYRMWRAAKERPEYN